MSKYFIDDKSVNDIMKIFKNQLNAMETKILDSVPSQLNYTLIKSLWDTSTNTEYPYIYRIDDELFRTNKIIRVSLVMDISDISIIVEKGEGYINILSKTLPETNLNVFINIGNIKQKSIDQFIPINHIVYYGNNRSLLRLNGYDLLILEPDAIGSLTDSDKRGKKCLGYIAISEVSKTRWFFPYCKGQDYIVETNETWGSYRINTASAEWKELLLNTIAPLILDDRNYDGIFFDTCDVPEYLEATYPTECAGAIQGMVDILHAFKQKWPNKIIACNNGLQPIIDASDAVDYYFIESTINTWKVDGSNVTYVPTSQESKDYLYPRIERIQNLNIPILDIEYGDINDLSNTNKIMKDAISKLWNPFVSIRDLMWFPNIDSMDEEIGKPVFPEGR